MNGIVWLASYPKSGNTWFRAFISAFLDENDEGISINKMKTDGIFSSRPLLDAVAGIESSNLTAEETDRLRPLVYRHLAEVSGKTLFIKAHDAYTYLGDGTPLLATENAKAVYILRNPFDVAVSFANHASKDLDRTIADMGDVRTSFCGDERSLPSQTRQKLLSWSAHAESWANATELPVHFIRYEDMKEDPIHAFTEAMRFIGLACTEEKVRLAAELSSFDRLKQEEESGGFKERPFRTASFFRSGRVGDWRNHLSGAQRDRIIAYHGKVMVKYGYLDGEGNPVY
jgi:hypothetical protein